MPNDLLQTGGAGLGGSIIGALATFFGFKSRIDSLDKSLEKVVFKDVCDERFERLKENIQGVDTKIDHFGEKIDKILDKLP